MPHFPKPYFRKNRQTWTVQINGHQHNLGRDRDAVNCGFICQVSLYFANKSHFAAICIEGAAAFVDVLSFLPFLDLVARATPSKAAGLGYALVFSLGTFSTSVSDILGSWAFDTLGLTFVDLIWANIGTTLVVFLFLPFIPTALTSSRDGEECTIA